MAVEDALCLSEIVGFVRRLVISDQRVSQHPEAVGLLGFIIKVQATYSVEGLQLLSHGILLVERTFNLIKVQGHSALGEAVLIEELSMLNVYFFKVTQDIDELCLIPAFKSFDELLGQRALIFSFFRLFHPLFVYFLLLFHLHHYSDHGVVIIFIIDNHIFVGSAIKIVIFISVIVGEICSTNLLLIFLFHEK